MGGTRRWRFDTGQDRALLFVAGVFSNTYLVSIMPLRSCLVDTHDSRKTRGWKKSSIGVHQYFMCLDFGVTRRQS